MPITLKEALALPQADYMTVAQSGIDLAKAVSAEAHCAVITHTAGKKTIAAIKAPLEDNLGIAIENSAKKTLTVAQALYWPEGVEEAIRLARRNTRDPLQIHLIGALHGEEGQSDRYSPTHWAEQMQKVIDVINATPHAQLHTFDVGTKPHPATFAITPGDGKTVLVRGTPDIRSYDDFETLTGGGLSDLLNRTRREAFIYSHDLQSVEQPLVSRAFTPDNDAPLFVSYDGRQPTNIDRTIRPFTPRGRA